MSDERERLKLVTGEPLSVKKPGEFQIWTRSNPRVTRASPVSRRC